MKHIRRTFVFVITILLISCNSSGQKNNSINLDKNQLKKYENIFQDLKKNLSNENGKLWNHQLYGPILLVDKNSRVIIANEPDNKGILTKEGSVYVGILPKEINISNTAHNWNGKRWTMVMLPLPKDYNERLNLLTHELFHRIQPELGFVNINNKKGNHLDEVNCRIFLKLELEALKKALISKSNSLRQIHIRNALLFRNYRVNFFLDEKEVQTNRELNEVLAD